MAHRFAPASRHHCQYALPPAPTPSRRASVEAHIIEPLGAYDIVDLRIGHQILRARTTSGFVGRVGDVVYARLDPAQTHFFNSLTGEALPIKLGA